MTLHEMLILHNENIEKSFKESDHPRGNGGRFITKYEFAERDDLSKIAKKYKLESLSVTSLKDFCKQVDLLYAGGVENDKKIKNIIRLPNINQMLAIQLGISSIKCFFTKNQMLHCRPSRKAKYGQDLRIEEFKRIPIIIHNSNVLYYDGIAKNFFIPFADRENPEKVNKISFYKDKEKGNFAVTVGKMKILDLNMREYIKIGIGNNPQIHKSKKGGRLELHQQYSESPNRTDPPNTRLLASSAFNKSSISKSEIKSIHDRLNKVSKQIEKLTSKCDEQDKRFYKIALAIQEIAKQVVTL